MTAWTRPTWPVCNRTLMPCGWLGEFVRIVFTTPRVSFPVRWSNFWTMSTVSPRWIFLRLDPGILVDSLILLRVKFQAIINLLTSANNQQSCGAQWVSHGLIDWLEYDVLVRQHYFALFLLFGLTDGNVPAIEPILPGWYDSSYCSRPVFFFPSFPIESPAQAVRSHITHVCSYRQQNDCMVSGCCVCHHTVIVLLFNAFGLPCSPLLFLMHAIWASYIYYIDKHIILLIDFVNKIDC